MKKGLFVLIAFALTLLLVSQVDAQTVKIVPYAEHQTPPAVQEQIIPEEQVVPGQIIPQIQERKQIALSTYVIGIEDYEEQTGSYAISYVLIMDCDYNCSIDDLVLLNGWIRSTVPLRDEVINNRYLKSYRLYGHLEDGVELEDYPFDTQTISIVYEHKDLEVDALEIIPGRFTSVDPRVGLPGWDIEDAGAEVVAHIYITNRAYALYTHTLTLHRGEIGAFFTHFFPILLIMLIILVTYILKLDKVQLRLAISSSILLAAMVFHLTIANRLPPLGYLTFADRFMVLTYLITFTTFVVNIGLLKQTEVRQVTLANKFNVTVRKAAIILIPLSYILLFIFFK